MTALEETRTVSNFEVEALFSTKIITRIGTWNVCTLYQSGWLAQLIKEFDDYRLGILGISEVRWIESGKTVLYSCHEDRHERGVGLILSKEAVKALICWQPVNDRIITARFRSGHTKTTIVQVYVVTDSAGDVSKDNFYDQLQDVFNDIPNHDLKILIRDFSALLGGYRLGFENVVGVHASLTRLSDNGERLVSFCEYNGLYIGNTYFQHREIHKKAWRSLDGHTLNEIDFVCISQKYSSDLHNVRAYRKANVVKYLKMYNHHQFTPP